MFSYLSTLKSYHIDRHLSLKAFKTLHIVLIIKDGKRLFPKQKATHLSITKDILDQITGNKSVAINRLNIDTTFKIAWADFLRLREIMYTDTELKKISFLATKITRSNILFAKGNQYTFLCLKQSKTNIEYIDVQIILAVTGKRNKSGSNLSPAIYSELSAS